MLNKCNCQWEPWCENTENTRQSAERQKYLEKNIAKKSKIDTVVATETAGKLKTITTICLLLNFVVEKVKFSMEILVAL